MIHLFYRRVQRRRELEAMRWGKAMGKYVIGGLLLLSASVALAEDAARLAAGIENKKSDAIFIDNIYCHGLSSKTSCAELIDRLALAKNRYFSTDELNAISFKLGQLGYYSSYFVTLEPQEKPGIANLIINVTEEPTERIMINGRQVNQHDIYGQLGFSDHNFLGKGYILQASLERLSELQHDNGYNVELVGAPINGLSWSLKALGTKQGETHQLFMVGLSYAIDQNSFATLYSGFNLMGVNYTRTTEDSSFIPLEGYLISGGLYYIRGGFGPTKGNVVPSVDARHHWQIGAMHGHDGVLTVAYQLNSRLNPSVRSAANPDVNGFMGESGITYALVTVDHKGRRSAWYAGIGNAGISQMGFASIEQSSEDHFYVSGGYKKSLSQLDLSLGLILMGGTPR